MARPSVLVICAQNQWFSAARLPSALHAAGADVQLFAVRDCFARFSRYLSRSVEIEVGMSFVQWVDALFDLVRTSRPILVIPADEQAFRLLTELVLNPPSGLRPDVRSELEGLIVRSLGDPAHFRSSVDKIQLTEIARTAAVPQPQSVIVNTLSQARQAASAVGWPVVVKRRHSYGGSGVTVVENESALDRLVGQWLSPGAAQDTLAAPQLVLQRFDPRGVWSYWVTAYRGKVLAGWAARKIREHPARGPATVRQHCEHLQMRRYSEALCNAFDLTGVCGFQFFADADGGDPVLIEINRRITPGMGNASLLGIAFFEPLLAALGASQDEASELARRAPGGQILVEFPQEWIRDSDSEYLHRYPNDFPWNDLHVARALMNAALGHPLE